MLPQRFELGASVPSLRELEACNKSDNEHADKHTSISRSVGFTKLLSPNLMIQNCWFSS